MKQNPYRTMGSDDLGAQGTPKSGIEVLVERVERLEERVRELEKWQELTDAQSAKAYESELDKKRRLGLR